MGEPFQVMAAGCGGFVHHAGVAPSHCEAEPTVVGLVMFRRRDARPATATSWPGGVTTGSSSARGHGNSVTPRRDSQDPTVPSKPDPDLHDPGLHPAHSPADTVTEPDTSGGTRPGTVLGRLLAACMSEARARAHLRAGLLFVAGEPVTDPDAPWPVPVVLRS